LHHVCMLGRKTTVSTQLSDLIGHLNWNKTISPNPAAIAGSPYLHDEFQIGEVFYDGKYNISNVLLMHNLYNDDIEYKEKM